MSHFESWSWEIKEVRQLLIKLNYYKKVWCRDVEVCILRFQNRAVRPMLVYSPPWEPKISYSDLLQN
jgi:hypothetical protein